MNFSACQTCSFQRHQRSDSDDSSPSRDRHMSYGLLHSGTSPILSRTSSATSRVMERLNIEKADGGAGITIGKVYVATNCNIILIIMASIFLLVGAVLTAISYRPRDFEVEDRRFIDRQDWSWQTKIVGPSFLTIGFLMLISGLALCLIGWKISKEDRDRDYLHTSVRVQHIHSVHTVEKKYDHNPYMPTVAQALPVSLLSSNLPALIPVNVLAAMNDSSQQNLLSSSFDSATLAIDWGNLKPRRSASLQFPIEEPIIPPPEVKAPTNRRQSLPTFRTPGSPKTRTKKQRRRDSTSRHTVKLSDAKSVVESSGRGRSSGLPNFLRSISGSAKPKTSTVTPCPHPSMSKYYLNQSLNGSTSPPQTPLTSATLVRCCDCNSVPTFTSPPNLRRDIACFPISASESSFDQFDGPALTTVAVSPADWNHESQHFRLDPYPLLQTSNAGCDSLPRIEVTSPGRGTLNNSSEPFGFSNRTIQISSPTTSTEVWTQNDFNDGSKM